MKRHLWLISLLAVSCGGAELYVAKSKDHGAPFDLVLSELKREESKSIISVPGFHGRSAAGSRWLICMYNDLAAKRGFTYWTVIYPGEGKDVFPIALSQSPSMNAAEILGTEFVAERRFPPEPQSVQWWRERICGWMQ